MIKANSTSERLLREPALTLDKCVHACRASELSKQDAVVLEQTEDTAVHAVQQKNRTQCRRKEQTSEIGHLRVTNRADILWATACNEKGGLPCVWEEVHTM